MTSPFSMEFLPLLPLLLQDPSVLCFSNAWFPPRRVSFLRMSRYRVVVPSRGQGEGHRSEWVWGPGRSSAAQCCLQVRLLHVHPHLRCFWTPDFRGGDHRKILSCSKTAFSSFRKFWSVSYSLGCSRKVLVATLGSVLVFRLLL